MASIRTVPCVTVSLPLSVVPSVYVTQKPKVADVAVVQKVKPSSTGAPCPVGAGVVVGGLVIGGLVIGGAVTGGLATEGLVDVVVEMCLLSGLVELEVPGCFV